VFVLASGPLVGEAASRSGATAAPIPASVLEVAGGAELPLGAAARPDGEPLRVTGGQLQVQGPQAAQVVVNADRAIAAPEEHFKLHDPPRVVVNIPGALDTWRANLPGPAEGPVKGVRSAQYKERPQPVVRVVVDLRGDFPYRLEAAGNQLRVFIGGEVAQAAPGPPGTPTPTPRLAPPPASGDQPPVASTAAAAGQVRRVDVRALRGRSRIAIATSGNVTFNITEVSDPPSLVVDIPDAIIDPRAAKAVELRQSTTPVQRVRSAQHQEDSRRSVRVVADLRGPAKYEVAQVGSMIQVDLIAQPTALQAAPPPPPGAPPPPGPPPPAAGEAPPGAPPSAAQPTGAPARISMDFKDADINNLLRIIAEVSGLNVVAGSDVTGKVTVRLINVEWPQALDLILKINNLAYEQDGNVIRVASQAALQRERDARARAQEQEARAREAQRRAAIQLEPLQFRIIPINYARAQDVFTALRDLTTKERPGASMVVDGRTNSLIINDLPATISRVESLLKTIDRPTPQVMIESRIVEASKNFAQSLGVQWGAGIGAATNKTAFPATGAIFGSSAVPGPIPVPGIYTAPTPSSATNQIGSAAGPVPVFINFPASVQGITAPALGLTLGSVRNPAVLGFQLSAAETESKIRTLSAPKVMTLENVEAEIRQGTQVPYTTIDSSGRTVVAFQDAFIRLKVTPKVTNDRRIGMKVEAERTFPGDRIDYAGGFAFPLNQRRATTNVLVSNGATLVIGGLLQSDERYSENRLPFLGDIPLLGILFKSKNIGPDSRIELLIFITPTIVEEPRVS
jgi:type IV pilus assembly protein PilQ